MRANQMGLVLSSTAIPQEIKAPVQRPFLSLTKSLYNFEPEAFKNYETEYAKLGHMVSNPKATVLDLYASVNELHEKQYNPNKEDATMRSTAGKVALAVLFIPLFFASQVRKAMVETMPVLTNIFELGESILERDIFKAFNAMEAIVNVIFNENSESPIALKDASKKKTKEKEEDKKVEKSEEVKPEEVKVEAKLEEVKAESAKEPEAVQEDEPRDDIPEDRL